MYYNELDVFYAVQELLSAGIYNTVKVRRIYSTNDYTKFSYSVELTRDSYRHIDDCAEWNYDTGIAWGTDRPSDHTRLLESCEYTTAESLLREFGWILDELGTGDKYALIQAYIAYGTEHDEDCTLDDCTCDLFAGHGVLVDIV